MTVTQTLLAISIGYVVVALLLMVLLLRSLWAWWVKALAIVITCGFSIFAFQTGRELLGWAGYGRLPDRFQVLWVRIVEPSRAYNDPGAIFLWVEELDENNIPSGIPRAYKVRYTRALADRSQKVREEIISGKSQQGEAKDIDPDAPNTEAAGNDLRGTALPPADLASAQESSGNLDPELLAQQPQQIEFAPLALPLLPVKRP
jgi:hypothetical protein